MIQPCGTDAVTFDMDGIYILLKGKNREIRYLEIWQLYQGRSPETMPVFPVEVDGVRQVALAPEPVVPERYLSCLEQVWNDNPVDLILFSGGGWGDEMAVRLSCRIGGSACLQAQDWQRTAEGLAVNRPVYGAHLSGTFVMTGSPFCMAAARASGNSSDTVALSEKRRITMSPLPMSCDWVRAYDHQPPSVSGDLSHADKVVVVGQGAGSRKTVEAVRGIAEKIGAETGASRPVVMNGWMPMDRLIGASGRVISPEICIAAGVSGSAVFTAGIRGSGLIIAVNTDADAPIFHMAHVGIVGELLPVLEALSDIFAEEGETPCPGGRG